MHSSLISVAAFGIIGIGGNALLKNRNKTRNKSDGLPKCNKEIGLGDAYILVHALNKEMVEYKSGNINKISDDEYRQIVERLNEILEIYPELSIHAHSLNNRKHIASSCKLSIDESEMILRQLDTRITDAKEAYNNGHPIYTDEYYNSLLERSAKLQKDHTSLVGIVKALKTYHEVELDKTILESKQNSKLMLRALNDQINTLIELNQRGVSYLSDAQYDKKVQLAKDIIAAYPSLDGIVDSFNKYDDFKKTDSKNNDKLSEHDVHLLLIQFNYEISMANKNYSYGITKKQIGDYKFDQMVDRAKELIVLYPQFRAYVSYLSPNFPFIVNGHVSKFDAKYIIPCLEKKLNKYSDTYFNGTKLVGNEYFNTMKEHYDNLVEEYPEYSNGLKIIDTLKEKKISQANNLNLNIQEQNFYYNKNKAIVEDEEYNANKKKLAEIVEEYPEITESLIIYKSLDEIDAHKKLISLNKSIENYKDAYSNGKPMISNKKYDETIKLAAEIEESNPKLQGTVKHFADQKNLAGMPVYDPCPDPGDPKYEECLCNASHTC